MLTRFVRTQLIIFTIAGVVGAVVMIFGYMRVPTLLGWGRVTVTLELPASGGLYRFSNVTYRGAHIGEVTDIDVHDASVVRATLSLDRSAKVPSDLVAQVRSMSAVGEQYVDLQPRSEAPPYLHDGSVIPMAHTTIPQRVGPMIDQLSSLVDSLPKDRLNSLLDESNRAFNGAGYDLGSMLDSTSTLTHDLAAVSDRTRALIDDSGPLLDGQAQTTDDLRTWARSLAGITDQLHQNDPQVRTLLQRGPGFADEVSRLLNQIKPTLPVLLANLTTIGQVAVTYNAALEQILVLIPPQVAADLSGGGTNNPTGHSLVDFAMALGDPPACTVGFLPPSQWRSPADTTEVDTPDGLYCKLPQDSPLAVRGARNFPCVDVPGKRAAFVQDCHSDKPFQPLAMRQHALGPAPLDPNLIAQGVPPDDRVLPDSNIFGPLDGTPIPPPPVNNTAPPPDSPGVGGEPGVPSLPGPDTPAGQADSTVQPSGAADQSNTAGPSVAVAKYNPSSGAYMASDGHMYHQTNLVGTAKTWQDLVLVS
ncbi:MCE family protein [Mycobacterium sp. 48b]|uniref:MCE family protein n=1 Tax=Mycobacterium sp. 48b TaxID=3400426 RepID=UPI003AAC1E0A